MENTKMPDGYILLSCCEREIATPQYSKTEEDAIAEMLKEFADALGVDVEAIEFDPEKNLFVDGDECFIDRSSAFCLNKNHDNCDWRIVPCDSIRTVPAKKTLSQTIIVSKKDANWIRFWLSDNSGDRRLPDGESFSLTAKFENGNEIDIKVCGSDDSAAWTEAVMFNDKGGELACTEPGDEFFGEWNMSDENTDYVVNVIEAPLE